MARYPHRLIVGLSLTDEQRAWLDAKAQAEDRSLAYVLRALVAEAMQDQPSEGSRMSASPGARNGH